MDFIVSSIAVRSIVAQAVDPANVVPAAQGITNAFQFWSLVVMLGFLLLRQAMDKGVLTKLLKGVEDRLSFVSGHQQGSYEVILKRLDRLEAAVNIVATPTVESPDATTVAAPSVVVSPSADSKSISLPSSLVDVGPLPPKPVHYSPFVQHDATPQIVLPPINPNPPGPATS